MEELIMQVSTNDEEVTESLKEFEKIERDESNDSLRLLINEIKGFQPLTRDEEVKYFAALRTFPEGSNEYESIKEFLVNSNLKLVASIAYKHIGSGMEICDMINEGTFGLLKAIEKFDHTKEIKFSTYAYSWIKIYIEIAINKNTNQIRVPMWIKAKLSQLYRAELALSESKNCDIESLTNEELSVIMKCEPSMVADLKEIRDRNNTVSIDEVTTELEDINRVYEVPDLSPTQIIKMITEENSQKVLEIIDRLPKAKYRDVIKLRFGFTTGKPMNLAEIGRYYASMGATRGTSREAIRQKEVAALNILRRDYADELKEVLLCDIK